MGIGYDLIYAAAGVVSSPVWITRLIRTGKWRTDWAGRFGKAALHTTEKRRPRILFHAVSVGEAAAIRPLIAYLQEHEPGVDLIIASTTNTGYARATALYGQRHEVVRYPLDFSFADRRFLDSVQPDVVALVELELWPNMLELCEKRGIPVCVVNGRLSERSFRRYRWLGPVARRAFSHLTAAGVQNETYAARFRTLGTPADRVHVLDTMKWDAAKVCDKVDGADELAAAMGIRRDLPVVVAGSTGLGEEKMLIDVCPPGPPGSPGVQLVLVPRKPDRFEEVAKLREGIVRRTHTPGVAASAAMSDMSDMSEMNKNSNQRIGQDGGPSCPGKPGPTRVFLVDTMGELAKAYSLADVAVVGRSFNKQGGSDPIEPIALGKATVIGPGYENFASVVEALVEGGGIVVADVGGDVGGAVAQLLGDKSRAEAVARAGRAVISARRGAAKRHGEMLMGVLRGKNG